MRVFLPLKIFFVLLVIGIGILLSYWRSRVDQHLRDMVPAVERGVIIGAFAMLLWPAMDYGYQQTANVLFGHSGHGPQLRLSLVIAPWALLLLFYFLRRLGKQGETIGQIAGVVTAAVAVLRYEDLNDWAVRLLGTGSQELDRSPASAWSRWPALLRCCGPGRSTSCRMRTRRSQGGDRRGRHPSRGRRRRLQLAPPSRAIPQLRPPETADAHRVRSRGWRADQARRGRRSPRPWCGSTC